MRTDRICSPSRSGIEVHKRRAALGKVKKAVTECTHSLQLRLLRDDLPLLYSSRRDLSRPFRDYFKKFSGVLRGVAGRQIVLRRRASVSRGSAGDYRSYSSPLVLNCGQEDMKSSLREGQDAPKKQKWVVCLHLAEVLRCPKPVSTQKRSGKPLLFRIGAGKRT